jgi:NADH-quinone oxidoreductase subunit L
MLLPLVVLALGAIVAGALNLPFGSDFHVLEHWLEPSLLGNETGLDLSGATIAVLAILTAAAAVVAILAAGAVYLLGRGDRAVIEQPVLAHAWHVDEAYAAVAGGPGRQAFDGWAWFDRNGVDGAVNGAAAVVRHAASALRTTQTGFVRSYALGIAVGAAALLGLFLSRAAF